MEEIRLTEKHLSSVTFTNGLGWDEPHPTCEGFTFTTEKGDTITYGIKPGHHQTVANLPYDERQLALFVLTLNWVTAFDSHDRIKYATWVIDKDHFPVNVLGLAGIYPGKSRSIGGNSVQEISLNLYAVLDKHLHITGEDMKNVSLGIVDKDAN